MANRSKLVEVGPTEPVLLTDPDLDYVTGAWIVLNPSVDISVGGPDIIVGGPFKIEANKVMSFPVAASDKLYAIAATEGNIDVLQGGV